MKADNFCFSTFLFSIKTGVTTGISRVVKSTTLKYSLEAQLTNTFDFVASASALRASDTLYDPNTGTEIATQLFLTDFPFPNDTVLFHQVALTPHIKPDKTRK